MAIGALAIVVITGLFILLLIILIGAIAAGSRKRGSPAPSLQPDSPANNPEARNQRREAILDKLAQKEITRDEAEQQLLELDTPLPEQMPTPPRPPKGGCGSGCLIAVICGLVALVLAILLIISLLFVGVRTTSEEYHEVRTQEMRS